MESYLLRGNTLLDEIEPLPDGCRPLRNVRLAWITVAITFDLTSIRDLTETEIANELGVSSAALRCATAKFREIVTAPCHRMTRAPQPKRLSRCGLAVELLLR